MWLGLLLQQLLMNLVIILAWNMIPMNASAQMTNVLWLPLRGNIFSFLKRNLLAIVFMHKICLLLYVFILCFFLLFCYFFLLFLLFYLLVTKYYFFNYITEVHLCFSVGNLWFSFEPAPKTSFLSFLLHSQDFSILHFIINIIE